MSKRQPAQEDVRADAVISPVVDESDGDGELQVPVDALDLMQLLVTQRDVLGAEVRIAGRR